MATKSTKGSRYSGKKTPEKPPTDREATIGSKAIRTGHLTPKETRTVGGRLLSERSVAAKAARRYGPKKKTR